MRLLRFALKSLPLPTALIIMIMVLAALAKPDLHSLLLTPAYQMLLSLLLKKYMAVMLAIALNAQSLSPDSIVELLVFVAGLLMITVWFITQQDHVTYVKTGHSPKFGIIPKDNTLAKVGVQIVILVETNAAVKPVNPEVLHNLEVPVLSGLIQIHLLLLRHHMLRPQLMAVLNTHPISFAIPAVLISSRLPITNATI